jgi:hypothetical protein
MQIEGELSIGKKGDRNFNFGDKQLLYDSHYHAKIQTKHPE